MRRFSRDVDAVTTDLGLQLLRRSVGDRHPVIEHDDVVREPVRLLEVLRREDDRRALADGRR